MVAVDAHAHVIVPELLRDAAPSESWRPSVAREQGRQVVELSGRKITSAVNEFVDLDVILANLDQLGIGAALLCPWVPLLFYGVAAEEGLARCRLQNLGLARLRERRPERVSVLGAVPLQDPGLAARELADLMAGGQFAGVEVTASVNGTYLGDPRFRPFWAAAEECDALVFIHPTTSGFTSSAFAEHYLWNLVGNPMETTLAAAHLVLSRTMARHPGLRVLLAHGGGAIVALSGRLGHGQRRVAAAGPAPSEPRDAADALIRRFLFDTVTHDPQLLAALVRAVGAERVLLGSDYPFDMADPHPVQTVEAAGLGEEAQRAILGANAARELKLPTQARI
ncbi:MAG TPA: amidohydrolase family protein [Solirubrobacteraceae bacterium]|jgi:aminocarboxymuconate-semialdehyde decarboxylase